MKTQPIDIRERTFRLAVRIVKRVRAAPRDAASAVITRQFARSATSVGANIEEAQGSDSKRDFTRRMNIARREARETLYWLRLMSEADVMESSRLTEVIRETDEIVRILRAIVKRSRENG